MAVVISNSNIEEHNVNKYDFKNLSEQRNQQNEHIVQSNVEINSVIQNSEIDSSELSSSSKDHLIESLIKKTEDMSANFLKLQAKIEARDDEYKKELQEAKERAFRDGLEQGIKDTQANNQAQFENAISQFSSSVIKLDNSAKEFEKALKNIESELIIAALDIAKEVVSIELSQNSSNIASKLSKELIDELNSSSNITLRVNPEDYEIVKQRVGSLENIELISDSAVSNGGVIAVSDAGNIDAQISKRFDRVKKTVLSE